MSERTAKTPPAGTGDEEINCDVKFTQIFEHGTKVKIRFSIELANYSLKDFHRVLSFVSSSARKFYLQVAEKISNRL
ncbi:hypothetical protein [Bacillus sp. FJAT-52991]|uniref:KTSC domain-containing protein n=1 Tax=Bacillus kandeliae TaxID=3129297 RepID=A0ABZ2N9Y2_9BACI